MNALIVESLFIGRKTLVSPKVSSPKDFHGKSRKRKETLPPATDRVTICEAVKTDYSVLFGGVKA
jgi:hypothetical protein